MNELFLYDRDKGLFREILNQSKTMEGRYHVSPNYGNDLNTSNLDAFFKDNAHGLSGPDQKYPITVCMTPVSRFTRINNQKWEEFYFTIYFLCMSGRDGKNQIKKVDRGTNTSSQLTWYDWSDMKESAGDFIEALRLIIQKKSIDNKPMKTVLNVDFERAVINRHTKFNNDLLNGVSLTFTAFLFNGSCDVVDYPDDFISNVTIPTEF